MAKEKSINVSISEEAKEQTNKIIITEEPYIPYKITEKLHKDLENANKDLIKGKITPYQLKVLITKYPHVPTFYNYLSVAYEDAQQYDKVIPVIKTLIKKFPYYFHAQLNLLSFYLKTENREALDAYFENVKSIQDVAPQKESFHVSEFMGFYTAFLEYLEVKRDKQKMQQILEMLDNVAPYFPSVKANLPNLKILLQRLDILLEVEEKAKQENAQIIHLKEDKSK